MSDAVGLVFSEEEIGECWYQWVPEGLVSQVLSGMSDWFVEQACAGIRDGGRLVWVWYR